MSFVNVFRANVTVKFKLFRHVKTQKEKKKYTQTQKLTNRKKKKKLNLKRKNANRCNKKICKKNPR